MTEMFQLDKRRAKINGVNVRSELHGEEHVPACDISLTVALGNDVLSYFDPALKVSLYAQDVGQAKQSDMIGGVSDSPVLRFPSLGPLNWGWKGAGYELTIHYGVTGDDIVMFVDIDKFRIACLDGGTVEVTFRAQAHPDEVSIGRLAMMIQCEADITLSPPVPEAGSGGGPLFGKDGAEQEPRDEKPAKSRRARKEAETSFE